MGMRRGAVLALALVVLGALAACDPGAPPGSYTPATVVYEGTRMRVHTPTAGVAPPEGRPVIVNIHGGGFYAGSADSFNQPLFPDQPTWGYASVAAARQIPRGWVVIDVDYEKVTDPGEQMITGALDDIGNVIDWVQDQGPTGGLDPTRVVLIGASAGGHLASLYSYVYGTDGSVRGVVNFDGPTDFVDVADMTVTTPLEDLPEGVHDVYGGAETYVQELPFAAVGCLDDGVRLTLQPDALIPCDPDALAMASPITHIGPSSPPTLLICAEDAAGPFPRFCEEHEAAATALTTAGVDNEQVEVLDANHLNIEYAFPAADLEDWLDAVTA